MKYNYRLVTQKFFEFGNSVSDDYGYDRNTREMYFDFKAFINI